MERKISPGRLIVLGFASVILLGAFLLWLPITNQSGVLVRPIDALFTSTSAVCVTGLIAVDTADTFNVFGRTIVALLIQVGGLGVTSVGVALIILAGKNVGIRERTLVKEAWNLSSLKGIVKLVKKVLFMTIFFEGIGAVFSFFVFVKDYPPMKAVGISLFHSVAAFNNSGFDILGGFTNLIPYQDNILLNLITCGLIIFGGLGFFVIRDMMEKRSFRNFTLHTKVVLIMTVGLLAAGTVLLKLTTHITWLGAFFNSTSARTAGFSTFPLNGFTNAALFILVILMFIGASPGSTGGGIKTTTAFVLAKAAYSVGANKHCMAFKRTIPKDVITKAFMITLLSSFVVTIGTLLLCILEPECTFIQILVEVTSAFATVGLSTGITPNLCDVSKLILILIMFIGRLGPITMLTIWTYKPVSNTRYSEEKIIIG